MKRDNPRYWRSFDELAATEEFRAFVEDEFPNRAPDWNDPRSRRRFLRLMGASIALAGASACTKQPKELMFPMYDSRRNSFPANHCFTPRRGASRALRLVFLPRAIWAVRRKSRAIRSIPRASEQPTPPCKPAS